jgi:hypothetical protein
MIFFGFDCIIKFLRGYWRFKRGDRRGREFWNVVKERRRRWKGRWV